MSKSFPFSLRKHLRKEKARIRRENFDLEEQKKKIRELYDKTLKLHFSEKTEEISKI